MPNRSRVLRPAPARHVVSRRLSWLLNDSRFDRHQLLRFGLAEVRFAVTVDVGTRMDGYVLMNDIAGHMRGAGQDHLLGFDLAVDRARDFDLIAIDGALHFRARADLHRLTADVAVHFAIDLDVFGAFQLARDLEGLADHGHAWRSCR